MIDNIFNLIFICMSLVAIAGFAILVAANTDIDITYLVIFGIGLPVLLRLSRLEDKMKEKK